MSSRKARFSWRGKLIVGLLASLILGVCTWIYWEQDSYGAEVGGVIPLHIIRYLSGAEISFESVRRDGNKIILAGTIKDVSRLESGLFLCSEVNISQSGLIQTDYPALLPVLQKNGEGTFEIDLSNAPSSASFLNWQLKLKNSHGGSFTDPVAFKTPIPGRIVKGAGFVKTPKALTNGDLQMSLESFNVSQYFTSSPRFLPPYSRRWDWASWRDWFFPPPPFVTISAYTTAQFEVSQPGWRLSPFLKVEPNFGFGKADDVNCSAFDPIWPEDGPYRLTAYAIHTTVLSPPELQGLKWPTTGQTLINKSYSFGKATITIESLRRGYDGCVEILVKAKGTFVQIDLKEPTENFNHSMEMETENPADEIQGGSLTLVMPEHESERSLKFSDTDPFNISIILADETRPFVFVAQPALMKVQQ